MLETKSETIIEKINGMYLKDNQDEYDYFDALNLGIYLWKYYREKLLRLPSIIFLSIAFLYASIPAVWKLIIKDETFFCKENMIIFGIQFFPMFWLKLSSLTLSNYTVHLYKIKLHFKMHILTMIDPQYAVNN